MVSTSSSSPAVGLAMGGRLVARQTRINACGRMSDPRSWLSFPAESTSRGAVGLLIPTLSQPLRAHVAGDPSNERLDPQPYRAGECSLRYSVTESPQHVRSSTVIRNEVQNSVGAGRDGDRSYRRGTRNPGLLRHQAGD